MIRKTVATAVLTLALAACSGAPEEAQTADANGVDPALASALQDQIMVDPALAQQANGDAVRPPNQPYSGGVPHEAVAANGNEPPTEGLMKAPAPTPADKSCKNCAAGREAVTLGGLAEAQGGGAGSCAASIQYSAAWATRLPADVPLYPQARVTEAGGANGGSCALRAVSFSASASMQNMLDWYYTKMVKAGYTAEHQVDGDQHILGGTRARDDGAYVLYLTARPDGGTDVDLIANNGV